MNPGFSKFLKATPQDRRDVFLSKKREARINAIKDACRDYIQRTVVAERTFWDKIVILHGLRNWFAKRGELRGQGQRVSRHYYDVHRIFQSELGARALADRELGADCVSHARMFFNSPDLGLDQAAPGMFTLSVTEAMLGELRRDYARMTGMIIGAPPKFDVVMASVAAVENEINR
jgi:hypothetical protein